MQDGLDSAALVHCTVAFRYLIQRESKIEDLAGMDLFRPDQIDELLKIIVAFALVSAFAIAISAL